jgi:hypothetical protein
MRDEMKKLEASMNEVKEATKAKTIYAYAAAAATVNSNHPAKCHDELKLKRRALEITLDTSEVSDKDKHTLKTQTQEEITKLLQRANPDIEGISRLKNGNIKIHIFNDHNKRRLEEINWQQAISGLKPHQQTHRIVIHGVAKSDIDFTKDQRVLSDELETMFYSDADAIERVTPLRRNPKINSPHHSIVV